MFIFILTVVSMSLSLTIRWFASGIKDWEQFPYWYWWFCISVTTTWCICTFFFSNFFCHLHFFQYLVEVPAKWRNCLHVTSSHMISTCAQCAWANHKSTSFGFIPSEVQLLTFVFVVSSLCSHSYINIIV